MMQAPAEARNEVEILIERFNEWADDRILGLRDTAENLFFSDSVRFEALGGISWIRSAKTNLKRLAEEMA